MNQYGSKAPCFFGEHARRVGIDSMSEFLLRLRAIDVRVRSRIHDHAWTRRSQKLSNPFKIRQVERSTIMSNHFAEWR